MGAFVRRELIYPGCMLAEAAETSVRDREGG